MATNAVGFDFSKFVPGFDFLRQMAQPRGLAPSPAQWVAPTVDPEEIDRRIQELRTVLFWLEQNSTALQATIQALEVQKMTLTTLRSMNVGLTDMAQVFQQGVSDTMHSVSEVMRSAVPDLEAGSQAAEPAPSAAQAAAAPNPAGSAPQAAASQEPHASALDEAFAQAGQWWGSMMQTFQGIAQQAQADVLQRQADFVRAQEEAAAALAAKAEPAASQAESADSAESAKQAQADPAAGAKPAAGARRRSSTRTAGAKPATSAEAASGRSRTTRSRKPAA